MSRAREVLKKLNSINESKIRKITESSGRKVSDSLMRTIGRRVEEREVENGTIQLKPYEFVAASELYEYNGTLYVTARIANEGTGKYTGTIGDFEVSGDGHIEKEVDKVKGDVIAYYKLQGDTYYNANDEELEYGD